MQYKLDARIRHLLVDEFQDTNPTQWRLLQPLLATLAEGHDTGTRSVFVVGDDKQSIYGFRRAAPELLARADEWCGAHMRGQRHALASSFRSAQAIMDAVNAVFGDGSWIPGFPHHETHHHERWGLVELHPAVVVEAATAATATATLRNPLETPREDPEDTRRLREGHLIATRIRELIGAGTPVETRDGVRPLDYGDILILLRKRKHAEVYQRALREAGIPYLGASRGALLDTVEIRDLTALLDVLITPFDNLALARVLRSPIFSASDQDLIRLATRGIWYQRLLEIAPDSPPHSPLARAARLLPRWHMQALKLPVHDLLERVLGEGNIAARYEAAFPLSLRGRLRANLARLSLIALDLDSGRYPGLGRFLAELKRRREGEEDAPDEASTGHAAQVRLLTIHGAKGLEAEVVFLPDCTSGVGNDNTLPVLCEWPAQDARPRHFLLGTPKKSRDHHSAALYASRERRQAREDANLLYVAMTRARHALIVTGIEPARPSDTMWHARIRNGLIACAPPDPDGVLRLVSGSLPDGHASTSSGIGHAAPDMDPRLAAPLHVAEDETITPSHDTLAGDGGEAHAAQRRGAGIHALLEHLGAMPHIEDTTALRDCRARLDFHTDEAELRDWLMEARAVIAAHPALFDPRYFEHAWNEVPIRAQLGTRRFNGRMDRLIAYADHLLILDYKTHRVSDDALPALRDALCPQLDAYAAAVQRLWPDRPVKTGLLLTTNRRLVML